MGEENAPTKIGHLVEQHVWGQGANIGTREDGLKPRGVKSFAIDVSRVLRPIAPTFMLLAGALVLDTSDAKLLSGAMRALERTLGFSPSDLAAITVVQTLASAFSAPIWGIASDRLHRGKVLGVGCVCWGLCTAIMGSVSDLHSLIAARFLNGAALACMNPVAQSLLADLTVPELRGTCFGLFYSIGHMGEMVADTVIPPASNVVIFGVMGWRVVAYVIALVSLMYAVLVCAFINDPRTSVSKKHGEQLTFLQTFQVVVRCKTWLLICLQGIFGSMPYSTFGFLILWLQYIGFSDATAGMIVSMKSLGGMCGTLVAGMVGDWSARWSPDHGRIIVAQLADVLRVPVLFFLLLALPSANSGAAGYMVTLACLGFLMPFPSMACSRPVFTEVVRPDIRGSIIAYQSLVEASLGSIGALAAGRLATAVFNYKTNRNDIASMPDEIRLSNAAALGQALLFTTTIPWTICTILYGLVHFTYKHDRNAEVKRQTWQPL